MKLVFSLFISFFILSTSFAQKIDLKLKLKVGDTYSHTSSSVSKMTELVDGKEININITIGVKISFTILSLKDTIYKTNVRYNALSMKMEVNGKNIEVSSDNPGKDDKFSRAFTILTTKNFSVDMSTKGKLIKCDNIDSIFSSIADGFPELSTDQKQKILEQLQSSYGEKAFMSNFNMLTAIFPSTRVKKGDKWIVNTELKTSMEASVETTYELVDVTDDYYKIKGESKLQTLDKDSQVNGMPVKYNLGGSMFSDLKISKQTGWIIEGKITQKMEGNFEVKANEKFPDGTTVPMSYLTDITISGN